MNSKEKQASYIDELINVKRCFSGILVTNDNRYLTAVEVLPINFKFKTGSEMESIINNFEKYLKIAPVKIQIKTISKKTDIRKLIENSDEKFESYRVRTPATEGLHNDELNLINTLGSRQGVERRFYFILEYVPTDTYNAKNEEDILFYLNSAKSTIRQYLYACGNTVITHKDEDLFMLELCYSVLNKSKTKRTLYKNWNALVDKAQEYYNYDEEKIEQMQIPYANLIAPEEIKMFSNYCIIDGEYYTFLFIPSDSYPPYVAPAWLSGLINSGEGIDVDLFIKKENTNKIRGKIRQRARLNKARIKHMDQSGANYEEVSNALGATDYIKSKLSSGDLLFEINTMITISGDSFDDMYSKYAAVKEMMDATDVQLMECKYMVENALKSYLPINQLDKNLYSKTYRNITSSDLAGFYPPTSYEVSDDDGVVMGINKDNNSLVVLDLFNTDKYKNANMAIIGTTGAGKTYTLGVTLKRMAMQNIRIFLIAPLKGHEYYRVCKSVGGQVIKISSGSSNCINIMEIRPENMQVKFDLGLVSEDEEEIILSKKADSLLTFFKLIIPDMSYEEKELLDSAILRTYEKFGITKDNDSLVDHYETRLNSYGEEYQQAVYKPMPILADLHEILLEDEKTVRMANIINRFVNGTASSFNGQTNVDLDSPFTVLDISALSKELIPVGMFLALDYVWDKAKQDITEKKVIAVDETWMLIKNSELAANFVLEIFKIIRGYGGSAIAASQDIKDFFALNGGEYGKAIISNSKTKIVLNLEPEEAETVQDVLNLSNKERKDIESFERGNMLVSSNSNTFTLSFVASDIEEKLITTDPKKLKLLKDDKRFVDGIYIGETIPA